MSEPPFPPMKSAASPAPEDCLHPFKHEGLCPECGACDHEVVLNGACFLCGSEELDPVAMSPKKVDPAIVPVDRLRRR